MNESSDAATQSPLEWAKSIIRGDVRAIAQALSVIENREAPADALLTALRSLSTAEQKRSRVIGITGAAGTGKSTLTGALIEGIRKDGKTMGILAIDPSSALTGGALLGDRIRMQRHALDAGVLIRSMATRGAVGGVANATADALAVLKAAGKDYIVIETVGVGQDEMAVMDLVDVVVLVLTPGMSDDVQAMKAGIVEIADILVLNQADDPRIGQLELQVRESRELGDEHADAPSKALPPIIKTVATTGQGVPQLKIAIDAQATTVKRRRDSAPGGAAERITLDHLGIAVPSLAESLKFYEDLLGMRIAGTYDIPQERTRVAMLPAGEARIELLEPTQAESPVGRFLAKRGPGLHHVCLRVPDLAAAMTRLKAAGARLLNDTPQTGAGGHRYVFIHPSSAGGVLLELVEGENHR